MGIRESGEGTRLRVMASINEYWRKYRCSPSIIDICDMAQLKSSSHAFSIIRSLEFQGLILKRESYQARQIVPVWVAAAVDKAAEVVNG